MNSNYSNTQVLRKHRFPFQDFDMIHNYNVDGTIDGSEHGNDEFGNNLDDLMPRHSLFKWAFRRIHHLFVALGLRDMHVAEYAKKWGLIYRLLNEHVARNAVRVIEQLGFEAITCGHTHAAMDIERGGKRYINTGAWTERPLHYLRVNTTSIELCVYRDDERSV